MINSLALYKKNNNLYLIGVLFEDNRDKFIAFDKFHTPLIIKKLSVKQKNWLKNNDHTKSDKTKNCIFVGEYYLKPQKISEENPKGKAYTQLPGGGGVYKITRQHNFSNVKNLFKNTTFLKAVEKYGEFKDEFMKENENIKQFVRETIKNEYPMQVGVYQHQAKPSGNNRIFPY